MPIKNRIDMLSTGIRTPIGIKVFGTDLTQMERLATENRSRRQNRAGYHQRLCGTDYRRLLPQHRAGSTIGSLWDEHRQFSGGNRDRIGRRNGYHDGRGPGTLQRDRALSARTARFPVGATQVLVPIAGTVPLGQLAQVSLDKGAPGIRTENALLSAYIFVDIRGRDIGGYVVDAQQAVLEKS